VVLDDNTDLFDTESGLAVRDVRWDRVGFLLVGSWILGLHIEQLGNLSLRDNQFSDGRILCAFGIEQSRSK